MRESRDRILRAYISYAPRFLTHPGFLRTLVDAVIAPAETCQHLVADGPGCRANLIGADAAANQGREVAAPRAAFGQVGDVDRQEVHGYAADDGAALAGDDRFGARLALGGACRTRITVGISDRHDGEPARPRCRERRAIADTVTLGYEAHLDDAPLDLDHRPHRVWAPRRRIDAIERSARPHQVAMNGAAE